MNAKKHNSMAWKRFSVYIPIQLEISIGLEQRPDTIKSNSTLKERTIDRRIAKQGNALR